jgi:hypothetical protein
MMRMEIAKRDRKEKMTISIETMDRQTTTLKSKHNSTKNMLKPRQGLNEEISSTRLHRRKLGVWLKLYEFRQIQRWERGKETCTLSLLCVAANR